MFDEQVKKFLKEYGINIEEERKSVWDLKKGDVCYLTRVDGTTCGVVWNGTLLNIQARSLGMLSLTKREASLKVSEKIIYEYVKQFSYNFSDEEWKDETIRKYYPIYNYKNQKIECRFHTTEKGNLLYFKNVSDILSLALALGDKNFIELYLGVKVR